MKWPQASAGATLKFDDYFTRHSKMPPENPGCRTASMRSLEVFTGGNDTVSNPSLIGADVMAPGTGFHSPLCS